ncbi:MULTISPECIES: hypothetical protein [unclassified Ketobacter]|uniref:hypothetical protein n=1 Tax=unclassified Ketobacter TaxID=2639109 RepID=UPI000F2675F9|nr:MULTISPECIES: hypothetical protein [unclassified Ketobacter]RLT89218.1 MAG: hypothetical protein D9N13_12890 [Ketobacter sp. GenoA1]RLT95936.1 MAG: hypothetical protein D9N15_13960 [Ketobacter sp.]
MTKHEAKAEKKEELEREQGQSKQPRNKKSKRIQLSKTQRVNLRIISAILFGWILLCIGIFIYSPPTRDVRVTTQQSTYIQEAGQAPVYIRENEESVDERSDWTDFKISFLASAVEDTIFFIVIGGVIAIATLRKPEEEHIDNRIGFLFKDDSEGAANAKKYAKKAIEKLACYSEKSNVRIRVISYNEELDAFKVQTDWEFHLHNLYNNCAYKDDDTFHVDIETDNVGTKDGIQGEMLKIRTITTDGKKSKLSDITTSHLDDPEPIKGEKFNKQVGIRIESDEQCIYEVSFWMWCKSDVQYHQWVRRYTKNYVVEVHNSKDCEDIQICTQKPYNKTSDSSKTPTDANFKLLKAGEINEIYSGEMTPEQDMWVILKRQQKNS